MRFFVCCAAIAALTSCNRGGENKEAIRQAVIDRLATKGMANMMTVDLKDVKVTGDRADAVVHLTPKDTSGGATGMDMNYKLEKKGSSWVVLDPAGSGHGGAMGMPPGGAAPAGNEPHGGMAPPAGNAGPRDIPGSDMPKKQ